MPTNTPESIEMAKRLKELRKERNLSHVKLSEALREKYNIGISKDSLIAYEVTSATHDKASANQGMRVEYLRCLADFYGVSTDYILGIEPIKTSEPDIRTAAKCTGLTEENLIYLSTTHSNSKKAGDNIKNFHKYELSLINDFIDLCNEGVITADFWMMNHNLSQINRKKYDEDEVCGYPTNAEVAKFVREYGLTVLPLRSGVEYHAQQIGKELAEKLIHKYLKPVFEKHTEP